MRTLLLTFAALASADANFDVRTHWPGCASEVLNQGGCGSCWAFGSAEAVSDRFCIKGSKVALSPQSLVSCGDSKGGCGGGSPANAYRYIASHGLQSCTDQCKSGCEPYNCKHNTCTGCDKQCHDGSRAKFYKVDENSIVHSKLDSDEANVMAEIKAHGSITGSMGVYQNFMGSNWVKKYGKDAVYDDHEGSPHIGGHCIKLIGYGVSQGKNYWLLQNSWGPNWNDGGHIKILRGGGQSAGIIGDQAFWATPVKTVHGEYANSTWKPLDLVARADEVSSFPVTGGWSVADHSHPYFQGLAQQTFAESNAEGTFVDLLHLETQVVAGFNAKFTVATSAGSVVIHSSHDMHGSLLTATVVASGVVV